MATGLAAHLPARWAPAPARLLSGLLITVALGALFAPSSVWAATRTWTGNGGDDLWTTGGNWGGTAPTANDDLLFPDGALRMTTNLNNFPGETKFNLIQFTGTAGGYVLGASNASAIYPVTTIVNTNGDNQINFNLRIPTVPTGGLTITTNGSGVLNVNAGITGVSASERLTKNGVGTLRFSGTSLNTYPALTSVNRGTLELNKDVLNGAIPAGGLDIGDNLGPAVVRLLQTGQIADAAPVAVNSSGLLDVNGNGDVVGLINLQSGTTSGSLITTGIGTLGINDDLSTTFVGTGAVGSTITGNLDLLGATRTFTVLDGAAAADLNIAAAISNGGLTKAGAGTLRFSGNVVNTYTGTTTVNGGTLELNNDGLNAAIKGPLVIGDGVGGANADVVRLLQSFEIADAVPITINSSGLLDLNGNNDSVGSLALQSGTASGARVTTGSGFLTLGGNVTVTTSGTGAVGATITGNLPLGGATRTFTIADGGAAADLDVVAAISDGPLGSANLVKSGPGTLRFSGSVTNSYTGFTAVTAGTLELNNSQINAAIVGPIFIGDSSGTGSANAAVVRLLQGDEIANTVAVTVHSSGWLDLAGQNDAVGSLTLQSGTSAGARVTTGTGFLTLGGNVSLAAGGTGAVSGTISGNLLLGGATRTFTIADGGAAADLDIAAAISNGGLTKSGPGTLRLTASNSYSGATTVSGGTLLVLGSQGGSAVTLNGGILAGTGPVGAIIGTSGTASPGSGGPAVLAANGNVALTAAARLDMQLAGTIAGSGYDQLNVSGTVNLGNATLALALDFTPAANTVFTLVNNDGTDPVTGTFAGRPEGAEFALNGTRLRISYVGGTGNDVTVTALPPPNVGVSVAPSTAGRLQSTIQARTATCAQNNTLVSLQFTQLDNATVELPGPPPSTVSSPTTVTLAGGPAQITFTVVRTTPGVASTVRLIVTDGCGTWPTFVGGGPNAF